MCPSPTKSRLRDEAIWKLQGNHMGLGEGFGRDRGGGDGDRRRVRDVCRLCRYGLEMWLKPLVWCDYSVGRKPEDGSFKGCGDSFVTARYEYSKNE